MCNDEVRQEGELGRGFLSKSELGNQSKKGILIKKGLMKRGSRQGL